MVPMQSIIQSSCPRSTTSVLFPRSFYTLLNLHYYEYNKCILGEAPVKE